MKWWQDLIRDAVVLLIVVAGSSFMVIQAVKQAVAKETTKIVQEFDQKFKRVDNVSSTIPMTATTKGASAQVQDSCIDLSRLTDPQKKRLFRWLQD